MRGVTYPCRRITNAHMEFHLTRLMRGVTDKGLMRRRYIENFNSHASCEA